MPAQTTNPAAHRNSGNTPSISKNSSQGYQLPIADIAEATQLTLWDGVDLDAAGLDQEQAKLIAEERYAGNRMMLALALPGISPTARIVAAALAYHGWLWELYTKLPKPP